MPALSKASLKALWTNFFQPTSADFADLISSWTDYYAGLETLGAAVSGGSTGLANFTSPSSISFISLGDTGSSLISTSVASSARSVLGLGTLAVLDSVSAGNVGTDSVGTAAIIDQNVTLAKLARVGTTGQSLISGGAAASPAYGWTGLVQRVETKSSAVVSGTAQIPLDDTIPQVTEGTQFLAVTITPRSASSTLLVRANVYFSSVNNVVVTGAIHTASSADAIAAVGATIGAAADGVLTIEHTFVAATVASIPVQLRLGGSGATTIHMNGSSAGARRFGGVAASILSVSEIAS